MCYHHVYEGKSSLYRDLNIIQCECEIQHHVMRENTILAA